MSTAADLTPAGTQTYSKAPSRFPPGCPDLAVSGRGCRLTGSDGREYIDFVSALGAVILGYRDPDVDEAVLAQLGRGVSFSLPTTLEAEVAERVCRLIPSAHGGMVRFLKNGADACDAAVRLARAATGRDRVVTIGYHGKSDWTVADTNPCGVPEGVRRDTTRVRYADIAALEWAVNFRPLRVGAYGAPVPVDMIPELAACVIMEPLCTAHPELPPPGYLEACRELCTNAGALLIFDEVVTGFRVALGGAQEAYGVTPDLTAAGKAMANGLPLSIVCGPKELMQRLAGEVFCSTTFGGETLSLAAAAATLDKLERLHVPARLAELGRALMEIFSALAAQHNLAGTETRIVGYPQRPVIQWRRPDLARTFGTAMLRQGYLFQGYLNLTLAHTTESQDALAAAFEAALGEARALLDAHPRLPDGDWK